VKKFSKLIAGALLGLPALSVAQDPRLYFDPPLSIVNVGDEVEVQILIDSNSELLLAVEATLDPGISDPDLTVVGGVGGVDVNSSNWNLLSVVNNVLGRINIVATRLPLDSISGTGIEVATFDVRVNTPGTHVMEFFDVGDVLGINSTTVTVLDGLASVGVQFDIENAVFTGILPEVSLQADVAVAEGNSGTTLVPVPVTLSVPLTQPVTFDLTLTDGSATLADSDYATTSTMFTIPAGVLGTTINVPVNGDLVSEGFESFEVMLSNPSPDIVGLTSDTATITIQNDDAPFDTDGDGVPDSEEATADNMGDGNNDGIQDYLQPEVASVFNPVSGGTTTVEAENGGQFTKVSIDPATGPYTGLPAGADFPFGLFCFDITLAAMQTEESVLLYGLSGDSYYSVNGSNAEEYLFQMSDSTGASTVAEGTRVFFNDGERGDFDSSANGLITSVSGPIIIVLSVGLDYFTAEVDNNNTSVELEWRTFEEINNQGFFIYRAIGKDGSDNLTLGEKINQTIIPAQGNEFQGHTYTYSDPLGLKALEQTRSYFLVDVELDGTQGVHGPFSTDDKFTSIDEWMNYE